MITILYLAKLADLLGRTEEQLVWHKGNSDDLLKLLRERDAVYAEALSANNVYKIALNNAIVHGTVDINAGDTVAFLPPVTGG